MSKKKKKTEQKQKKTSQKLAVLNSISSTVGTKVSATGKSITSAARASSSAVSNATVQAGQAVVGTAGNIGNTVVQAGQTVTDAAIATSATVSNIAVQAGQTVAGTAVNVGSTVGNAAIHAGQTVAGTAVNVGSTVGNTTAQAGQVVVGTAVAVGNTVGHATVQATEGVGQAVDVLENNPLFQKVTKVLKVDSFIPLLNQVDIVRAATEVQKLQQQYPTETSAKIAHRLMAKKAMFTGTSGFATSMIPGAAAPLVAVDLAANMVLQAEMVYQIAGAYGLDMQDPTRKGEILAIFGLSMGGNQAVKAGTQYAVKAGLLGFLRNVPVAGAVIGASTNAAMIYALGYAASRFYEAKINPLSSAKVLAASEAESEEYLKTAITQEALMDQILVHVILAGNPDKTWEQMLPEIQAFNLSPASLETISENIQSPPPLEDLLDQINSDFAVPLIGQCQKIALADSVITPKETEVLNLIMSKAAQTESRLLTNTNSASV